MLHWRLVTVLYRIKSEYPKRNADSCGFYVMDRVGFVGVDHLLVYIDSITFNHPKMRVAVVIFVQHQAANNIGTLVTCPYST